MGISGGGINTSVCRDNNIALYQYGITTSTCVLAGSNIFLPGSPLG